MLEKALLVASLIQHMLTEMLLPQVKAKVAVAGKIAPGVAFNQPL